MLERSLVNIEATGVKWNVQLKHVFCGGVFCCWFWGGFRERMCERALDIVRRGRIRVRQMKDMAQKGR